MPTCFSDRTDPTPQAGRTHHQVDRRQLRELRWRYAGTSMGTVKRNTVPCGEPGDTHKRPPCASMIERQIDNPKPRPSGFVVTNGSKIRGATAGSNPGPLSWTEIRTVPASVSADDTVRTLARSVTAFTASIAFRIRFNSTCCNCTR